MLTDKGKKGNNCRLFICQLNAIVESTGRSIISYKSISFSIYKLSIIRMKDFKLFATCTAPQNGAASAIGSAAGEQPGAVNMIFVGGLDTRSSIALMAAPLSH